MDAHSNSRWLTIMRHANGASMAQHSLGKQDHIVSSISCITFCIKDHEALIICHHQGTRNNVAIASSLNL